MHGRYSLETVDFRMALGKMPLWPDTIRGRAIRGTCVCHRVFVSCAPREVVQGRLRAQKSLLTTYFIIGNDQACKSYDVAEGHRYHLFRR